MLGGLEGGEISWRNGGKILMEDRKVAGGMEEIGSQKEGKYGMEDRKIIERETKVFR